MKRGTLIGSVVVLAFASLQMACLCGPCEVATTNKELAVAAFEAVAAGELDALDELVASDYVRHCQATPDLEVTSLGAFKQYLLSERESFPNPELKVVHLIAEDNLVAFWAIYAGVQEGPMGRFPATGNRMEVEFSGIHRIEDGKIAETWVTWDNMAGLAQLGLWPPQPPEETEIVE